MRKSPIDVYRDFENILSRDFISAKDFLYRLRLKELSRQSDQSFPNWPLRRQYLKGQYSYETFKSAYNLDQDSFSPGQDKRIINCDFCNKSIKYAYANIRILKQVRSWKRSFRLSTSEGQLIYLCEDCLKYNFILIIDKIRNREKAFIIAKYNDKGQIAINWQDEINPMIIIIDDHGIEINK